MLCELYVLIMLYIHALLHVICVVLSVSLLLHNIFTKMLIIKCLHKFSTNNKPLVMLSYLSLLNHDCVAGTINISGSSVFHTCT